MSPPSSPGLPGSPGSSFASSPPPKSARKSIRREKVPTSSVLKRRVLDYIDEVPSTSKRPSDSLNTFFQHTEQDIRQNVRPDLHDDLMQQISSTVFDFKKKQSPYIDVRNIPNYDPRLPVRSFQFVDESMLVESTKPVQQQQPPTSRTVPSATVSVRPPSPTQAYGTHGPIPIQQPKVHRIQHLLLTDENPDEVIKDVVDSEDVPDSHVFP